MRLDPGLARTFLPRVDPGRVRSGRAVGLRDGAALTLVAAGLTTLEIAALRATAVTLANRQAVVALQRDGISWCVVLSDELGGWLLAWLTEARCREAATRLRDGIKAMYSRSAEKLTAFGIPVRRPPPAKAAAKEEVKNKKSPETKPSEPGPNPDPPAASETHGTT